MPASEVPISKTKIILPKRRIELLSRARLLEILYERLDRKLIIVSAAAGYGKTSLLIDLAKHSDLPFCWLALDSLDRDPQRFIAYFIAAMAERFPQFGNRSRSILNGLTSLDDGMERLLVTLVNEIQDDIHEHFVLVLDDFHLLDETEPILYFINRFLQLIGENCHLVLSSRTLPELPDIPLLVAREEVGGLDFSDLSFRPEEIQALLAQNRQIHLSDEDARRLAEATEGWITGLQFADPSQLTSGESPFRSSHAVGVSLFDYLGQQVLEQQSKDLQIFILRSSLLEEFDAAVCEAVLGPLYTTPQDWPRLLETIVQKNLFALPVGKDGQWLRYHHLFGDYLQEQFRKQCPEEVTPILQRLAQYLEAHAEWEKAYQLYRGLGDTNVLADMIERAGTPMYQHAILTLESWLRGLPPSLVDNRPGLLSLRGVVEHIKGNAPEGVRLLDRAIAEMRGKKDVPALALALTRRGHARRFLGNYAEAIQDAAETLKLTEGKDDLQGIYGEAQRLQGLSLYRQGRTLQATTYLENALDVFTRLNDVTTIPLLLMETGMVRAAIGNYRDAKASYEKALEFWRRSGNLTAQASLLNNLGFLYYQLGEYDKAAEAFEEGLLCAQRSGYKRMEALISISMGDLYSEVEDFEVAAQNYARIDGLVQQLGDRFLIHYLLIAEANLALLRRDTARTRTILAHAGKLIKASESNYEYGHYQLARGRLALQNGNLQDAIAEFSEAQRCFTQDGREMESIWSCVWLAAANYKDGHQETAREAMASIPGMPNQISHSVIVATRQAMDWLEGLQNDRDAKSGLHRLIEKADRLDDQMPGIRRQLRRMARVVDVPSPKLIIRAFGPGQVWVNGRLVTMSEWQTQSVRELFFYFLAAERPLTREQIGTELWPGTEEPAKFKMRFKNEIYRLRCAVGQDVILFQQDCYQFNSSTDHEYDIEAFESFLSRARSAASAAEQINFYQRALDLVQGEYLQDMGANWVIPEQERLRQAYLLAALALAELYFKDGQSPKANQTCQWALTRDRTFEAAYRLQMQIYRRMGDKPSTIHTYRMCEQSMQEMFGMPPSDETQRLFRELTA